MDKTDKKVYWLAYVGSSFSLMSCGALIALESRWQWFALALGIVFSSWQTSIATKDKDRRRVQ